MTSTNASPVAPAAAPVGPYAAAGATGDTVIGNTLVPCERQSSTELRDAGTVYAEGVYSGLRMAVQMLARDSRCFVPTTLRYKLTEWEANVVHREWLAQQGRAVPHHISEQALAFIHAVIRAGGLGSLHVD